MLSAVNPAAGVERSDGGLARVIGLWGGLSVIVGITIGSGIFRKPTTLARDVGDPPAILGLWVFFGVVSLCGALTVAELASMLPKTGGIYVFLRAAYGDSAAFVVGWMYLLIATPGALGALSTFFAELLLGILGRPPEPGSWLVPGIASVTIGVLCIVNVLGARLGAGVQTALTIIKVAALVSLVIAAVASPGGSFAHLRPSAEGARNLGVGAASVIWAYDGWIAISMIAGEIKAPERELRRIIVAGLAIISSLYVAANVGYFYALPVGVMASESAGVPQRIMSDWLGPSGALLIGVAILCSVTGALNGNVLAKPRVPFALAQDGLTFGFLGRAHPRFATPHAAILIQGLAAILLVAALRDFDKLTAYAVVVEWSALMFAVAAVFVLRRRMPDAPRPFRVPGYPWVPLVFLLGTGTGLLAIVRGEIARDVPNYSPLVGLGLALLGFPVYALWRTRMRGRRDA